MNFTAWLREQGDRTDPVGGLARSIAADPEASRLTRLSELLPLLMARPYTEPRLEALRLARAEWERENGNDNEGGTMDERDTTVPAGSTPNGAGSSVKIWSRGKAIGGRSVVATAGVTEDEIERLIGLAEAAIERMGK